MAANLAVVENLGKSESQDISPPNPGRIVPYPLAALLCSL